MSATGNSGGFIWRMEDVLSLYPEPDDPALPVVCFGEATQEPDAEVYTPAPECPARRDYEYARRGTARLFLAVAPPPGCGP